MNCSASEIMYQIATDLISDHSPISLLNKSGYTEDDGFSAEELELMTKLEEGEKEEKEERVKYGDYTIFIIQGDIIRIKNEIIKPLHIHLKDSEGLDLEFREMSIENLFSSYQSIGTPKGSNGGVLIIEGIESLDYSYDYVSIFSRLTNSPVQTTENGSLSRWSLLFISKECEDEKFLFNTTWNYYRNKSKLLNLKLE